MNTTESVQAAVRAWRRTHPRGALPAALRRRVIDVCAALDPAEARSTFDVRPATLQRWLADASALPRDPPPASAPFAVVVLATKDTQRTFRIELIADNRRLHIEGAFTAEEVLTLIRALAS